MPLKAVQKVVYFGLVTLNRVKEDYFAPLNTIYKSNPTNPSIFSDTSSFCCKQGVRTISNHHEYELPQLQQQLAIRHGRGDSQYSAG